MLFYLYYFCIVIFKSQSEPLLQKNTNNQKSTKEKVKVTPLLLLSSSQSLEVTTVNSLICFQTFFWAFVNIHTQMGFKNSFKNSK